MSKDKDYWIIKIPKREIKMLPLVVFFGMTAPFWLLNKVSKRVDNLLKLIVNKYMDLVRF